MIKVLICDDDSLIRESLKILLPLKGDIEIVGEALDFCLKNKVDVALVDVRMPILNGVDAIKEINKKTETKCLILTTFDEEEYINEAISYGTKGYILKNSSPEKIANAIVSVHNESFKKYDFTEREKEIIQAISEGLSNKEISKKLFISEGTVRNYITNILDKTNLEHRTAIAVNYLKGNL